MVQAPLIFSIGGRHPLDFQSFDGDMVLAFCHPRRQLMQKVLSDAPNLEPQLANLLAQLVVCGAERLSLYLLGANTLP